MIQKFLVSDAWWEMFGTKVPNLQRIAIRILSQSSSASRCERNWSLFEHIHSKKRNRSAVKKLNDLVFVHYNLRLRHRQILGTDTTPIVLENVDPHAEWNTEVDDPVFSDEDVEWVDQVDREAEAVAMAVEEARARGDSVEDPEARSDGSQADDEDYVREEDDDDEDEEEVQGQPQTQAQRMALESSMTYLRRTRRRT